MFCGKTQPLPIRVRQPNHPLNELSKCVDLRTFLCEMSRLMILICCESNSVSAPPSMFYLDVFLTFTVIHYLTLIIRFIRS